MSKPFSQRGFVPLFYFVLIIDLLAAIAVATKEEVWMQLSTVWYGPLDDIFYLAVGFQAFFFLADPLGEKTRKENGEFLFSGLFDALKNGEGGEKTFARLFVQGAQKSMILLAGALATGLLASWLVSHPVISGCVYAVYRHLSLVLPVSLILAGGFAFLGIGRVTPRFWAVGGLGMAGLLVVALSDGRWNNHLYHLFVNLESMQAWAAAVAWAGLMNEEPAELQGAAQAA